MFNQQFQSWLHQYQLQALASKERRLVVLVGDDNWALSLLETQPLSPFKLPSAKSSVEIKENKKWLVYGDSTVLKANVQYKRYRDKLGSESDYVVFADSEFTIDAFASLSGTLVSGGIFFLVVTNEFFNTALKPTEKDLFSSRFFSFVRDMPSSEVIVQHRDNSLSHLLEKIADKKTLDKHSTHSILPFECVTNEQLAAVKAIKKVVTGHRNRPLVLTADRGRGKSSALAIACALLLVQHQEKNANTQDFKIIITAPSYEALSVFFTQLKSSLPDAKYTKNKVELNTGSVEFIPIDELLTSPPNANLVLIDEAAAVPVYLLVKLLTHYHRLVFSSTVHGYEGAGRGFTLKFQQELSKKYPQWQSLHMNQPIRWRENDPLEQLVFDSCLLNTELEVIAEKNKQIDVTQLSCQLVSAKTLIEDEKLLSSIFSVLVTAHYQTKPSDLKLLLNNKHTRLLAVFSENQVVAVTLLMIEGNTKYNYINDEDILTVKHSKQRLKNQFLPQSLLTHCGVEDAFNYQYLRVMRIAVHPQLQQQSIGTFLLQQVSHYAKEQGADFIGSSFGATAHLLSFWLQENYQVMRIGFTQDKASGEHSALVLNAISTKAKKCQKEIQYQFYRSFDYLLVDEYRSLSTDLVRLIQRHCPNDNLLPLTTFDLNNIEAFAKSERLFSSCVYSLHLWLKHQLSEHSINQSQDLNILIARVMQKHNVKDICQQYNLTGKKAMNESLKKIVKKYLK